MPVFGGQTRSLSEMVKSRTTLVSALDLATVACFITGNDVSFDDSYGYQEVLRWRSFIHYPDDGYDDGKPDQQYDASFLSNAEASFLLYIV